MDVRFWGPAYFQDKLLNFRSVASYFVSINVQVVDES